MNNLQKLLKLRGVRVPRLADDIGRGYHSVQKVIKGTRVWEHVRQDIADALGLKYYQVWGVKSDSIILKLIEDEIEKRTNEEGARLRSEYLNQSRSNERNCSNSD